MIFAQYKLAAIALSAVALFGAGLGVGWKAKGALDGKQIASLEGENNVLRLRVGVGDRQQESCKQQVAVLEDLHASDQMTLARMKALSEQYRTDAMKAQAEAREANAKLASALMAPSEVAPGDCCGMIRELGSRMLVFELAGIPMPRTETPP